MMLSKEASIELKLFRGGGGLKCSKYCASNDNKISKIVCLKRIKAKETVNLSSKSETCDLGIANDMD